jgi:coenzyme PQQ synthesis protein D (PqqD)/2-oxoglutarate-Fe(II)-dependent oxygenase superfamily protein
MLAKLTRLGISGDATPSELRSAREHFARHYYLRLAGFIELRLLQVIQRYLKRAKFEEKTSTVGRDLMLTNNPLVSVLYLLMNDPKLFSVIRRITGCGPIGCFNGRLYRMIARPGLDLTWHDDVTEDRKVAISINLSDARYHGGTFQLRERSRGVCDEVPNLGFGDAIIFRVAEHLEHRLTPVAGKVPKTALTGWFCSRPSYTAVRRDLVAQSQSAIAARASRKTQSLASLAPNDVVKIPSAVVSQTAAGETFVANISTAMCYGLNQTGGRIWELLAQGHSMRSISVVIAREYGAPRRDVERDVIALAGELAQRDLVKVVRTVSP